MNLKNLFVSRDKNFARITEAGDYLGRRLRENLVIFDIDDSQKNVTYVTESNHLISCDYREVKGRLTLENFIVEDLETITSDAAIDSRVEANVHKFMESLVSDRYDSAEINFDKIVESFSMRAQIGNSRKKLSKRLDRFNESYNIFETKSYKKFREALPLLKKFLEENVDTLSTNAKLVEGLRLSKVVGDTYDLPKLDIKNLKEEFVVVPINSKRTLYEMVCDKELVRKELLEAKESFSKMWHHNDNISSLASKIYATDPIVKDSLKEAVAAVPYLALANKVDLTSVMDATFQVSNPDTVPQKDIREFVNKIYEFKKPLKTIVLEALNSKYGVNIQSLRFVPSFKGLAEVQSEVLDMIAESCEEGILSDVLKEFATCMSRKGGVQVLDISNTLSQVMTESQFHVVDIDEDFHMKKLSDYLSHNLGEAQYYGDDDAMSNSGGNAGEGEKGDSENVKGKKKKKGEKNKDWGGNKGDIKAKDRNKDDDSKLTADEEGDVDDDKNDLPGDQEKLDKDKDGDIDAKDLKKLRKEGVEATAEETEEETEEEAPAEPTEEEEDAEAEEVENDQIEDQANNSEWRDLVASLEDVTKKIDLNFDEESIEDEEEDAEAGEGEEPTPPQDSPA
jgi:hypothetical protein